MKKSSVILAILLLALFAFTVTSVIAWYKKDVKKNVLLNENIESLDANYIYKNYVITNPGISGRPFFGNKDAEITMVGYLDSAADSSRIFMDDIYPTLKKEFIDKNRVRFVVKYYLDSTDLKDSERFKAYSFLECVRKLNGQNYNSIYMELIKSNNASEFAAAPENGFPGLKSCLATDNFENIKKDAKEVENFGMIGLNPRFYIGINGNSNTVIDGIPTITKINQTIRLYEIELGE